MLSTSALLTRFTALYLHFGGTEESAQKEFQNLADQYLQSWRRYHTLVHIARGLSDLDHIHQYAENPKALEFAYFYHDVIYKIGAPLGQNEIESAAFAKEALKNTKAGEKLEREVEELILATDWRLIPKTNDEKLMADIDLASLALPKPLFLADRHLIRQEYSRFSDAEFAAGEAELMGELLARKTIYQHQVFRPYENAARVNIREALERDLKQRNTSPRIPF